MTRGMIEARARRATGCLVAAWLVTASIVGRADAPKARTERMEEEGAVVDLLLDPQGISSMMLAPDGKHLASIVWTGYAQALLLTDAQTLNSTLLSQPEARSGWSGLIQPYHARWVSATQLAVDFNDGRCVLMGLDGRRGKILGDRCLSLVEADGKRLVVVQDEGILGGQSMRRIDLSTFESVDVPLGLPGDVVDTVFDRHGRLRAATTMETHWLSKGAKLANWYRHDEHSPWQKLLEVTPFEEHWHPVGVPDDGDTLAVLSRDGRDTWALFTYDVPTRHLTELRVGHPTEDLVQFAAALNEDDVQEIRVMTGGLKPTTYWFDSRWDQLQRSVDAALPDAVNILSGDKNGSVLVTSFSDRDPGHWLLLDTHAMKMRPLGAHRHLEAHWMRPMQTLTYTAPDGLRIPAYLTLPENGHPPYPMVVFIHGGPVARDHWQWDFDVQALALDGYAVLQPEFRGSSGFGRAFEEAGYRQWGLAMQDDVTAGVQAMIDRGTADAQRICIYGASYGGYAALWGLEKTPQLYRCGISFAGVSDIGELFSDWSDTNASKLGPDALRFKVGDVDTMKTQFDAVSPDKHADRIQVPVLLGHGRDDRRVVMSHSTRMASALEAAHKQVETHWYNDEGHGLRLVSHSRDFELALLDFLDRNIGPASPLAA
ncbi:MAG TPA: prolyl oligopeptidase family serine peptidase, partial [Burkholderiaceae bacterium]|nr:prolyl oligopeptidase family serine peptidase [Burkholderiaceae bacterium]